MVLLSIKLTKAKYALFVVTWINMVLLRDFHVNSYLFILRVLYLLTVNELTLYILYQGQ